MPAKPLTKTATAQQKARAHYNAVPTRTKAEDPALFSKTPHDYGDLLIKPNAKGETRLGGVLQRDLVYWIERHTWGANISRKKGEVIRPEWAKLSLSMLAKLCGSDRRTVARSLADLIARGILEERERKGCGDNAARMYKLTPERWRKAKYYSPKVMEVESDDEPPADNEEEVAAAEPAAEPESTVAPGRVSRPQAIGVNVSKGSPDVTIRVVYRNECEFPVTLRTRPGRNGRIQISCRAVTPHFFAADSPSKSVVTVESNQVNEYRAYLAPFVLSFWAKALDEVLLESVVSAAQGAPVSVFERIVHAKLSKSGARRHTSGILIELAKDAAAAHRQQSEADEKQAIAEAQERARTAAALERMITEAEAPSAPQAPPCPKCKGLGTVPKWSNRNGEYAERRETCQPCKGTGRTEAK